MVMATSLILSTSSGLGKQQMISHLQMRRAVGLGLIPTAIMECNAVCHLEKLKAYIPGDLVSLS